MRREKKKEREGGEKERERECVCERERGKEGELMTRPSIVLLLIVINLSNRHEPKKCQRKDRLLQSLYKLNCVWSKLYS